MTTGSDGAPALRLLVVCSMNQARSPLGEVIARDLLARRGVPATVVSAGTQVLEPMPAVEGSRAAAAKLGLDLEHHQSRPVTTELTAWADLVLTMERRHVIDLVADHEGRLESTFTLPELAGDAQYSDPAAVDEPAHDWLARITVFRRSADLLGGSGAPAEVSDPIGRSKRQFRRTADEIAHHLDVIFTALYGDHGADAAG